MLVRERQFKIGIRSHRVSLGADRPTSVQKHDARLDRLLRIPESELMRLVNQNHTYGMEAACYACGLHSPWFDEEVLKHSDSVS